MADAYTSIATGTAPGTEGLPYELVQDLWDTAVGVALKELPTARNFVDVRPKKPMANGDTITLEKIEFFDGATVAAMKTALDEEADVDSIAAPKPTPIDITCAEYGGAVTRTRKFANRSFAPVDPIIARQVAMLMNEVIDSLVQDTMVTGTNVSYGGDATEVDEIVNDDVLTAGLVRRAVARLRTAKAVPWFGNLYAGLVHPHTILDLREETGAGAWRVPAEYGAQGRIWAGEVGEFEGVRFVENALVRREPNEAATPVTTYQNYFLGRNALAEDVKTEPHVVISPQTDKLGRFHTIGWYGDLGWAIYEDKALQRVITGSSLGDDD